MKLTTVAKMKELENNANAGGYVFEKMMLKAGQGLSALVDERYRWGEGNFALGLVGGGNNGGDTLVALIDLQQKGWQCSAFVLKEETAQSHWINSLKSVGGQVLVFDEVGLPGLEVAVEEADLILDGAIGTGFQGSMRSPYVEVLQKVGQLAGEKNIVAVDCPSGVNCDTGEICDATLICDMTVCMEAVKEGLLKFPAFEVCGELAIVELGIPARFVNASGMTDVLIEREWVKSALPQRPLNSHKGTFGHLMVCGGSVNYPGAPMLAAKSAYRVGAGLVECAIPERIYEAAVCNNLESIFTLLESEDGVITENAWQTLKNKLADVQCLLVGPGIGQEDSTFRFLQRVLFQSETGKQTSRVGFVPPRSTIKTEKTDPLPPVVIDADGLRLLARVEDWHRKIGTQLVLTPHPGEMSALTGLTVADIQQSRFEVAREYAKKWGQVLVLKGALTIVADADGNLAVLPFASSALAKAGTGDVLAGMIAGLITQGSQPFEAAVIGVWLHAQAAVEVMQRQGSEACLLAGNLIEAIPQVYGLI